MTQKLYQPTTKEVKKEIVRNVFRDSDTIKLYCIHVIPLYGSVIIILRWCYDYIFFLVYIWIDKSYDSDDLTLTQMVLQRITEVNYEDENMEDEEDNANFVEMSDKGANEGPFWFVVDITSLR